MHRLETYTIDKITKIEGNAGIEVKIRDKKVEELKFIIKDFRRFYTDAVKEKNYIAVPPYLSRICGTCSIAHQMASIEACEKALEIYDKLDPQIETLRWLLMNGLMIRDHCLHLYFFSLPDILNIDSVLDVPEGDKNEILLHDSFDLKTVGSKLCTIIAGSAVHTPFPTIGGFIRTPDQKELEKLIPQLEACREKILRGIDVFFNWKQELIRNTDYVALVSDKFNFLKGEIKLSNGQIFPEEEFLDFCDEVVVPYSQSEGYKLETSNEDYLVGALARINLNKKGLNPRTQKSAEKYLKIFPSNNIYHNNLAQAIEVLHAIDDSIDIIQNLKIKQLKLIPPQLKKGTGIGVIEAPRGTLYHKVELDENGIVVKADVIVPTSQNQINMENDLKEFFSKNISKLSREELRLEAEKIIRAYDPCMSCATNFLKIKWE